MHCDASLLRSKNWRLAKFLTVLLLVVAVVGCGSNLAEVNGVVTVDGQPLQGGNGVRATVIFQPATGVGRVAVGLVDSSGQYHLSSGSEAGVVPGEYVVTCSATQLVRGSDGSVSGGRRVTDPKYADTKTSGLQFTVEPGSNEFNISLTSASGRKPN
jgi:hypothetical protein